ncbi:MAG: pyruvate oxidoreductase subunit gamma [Firmicutes bacterium]|nr:pyruvate oxidoreductase subunit gamma [Bacillota bacterium]
MQKRIIFGGEGGQGVQSAADILAQAAFEEGLEALYIPNFGIEQRGGISLAYVQVGEKTIGSPKFLRADLAVAFSGRALARLEPYIGPESSVLYDSTLLAPPEVAAEVVGRQAYNTIAPEAFAERQLTKKRQKFPEIEAKRERILGIPAGEIAREKLHPRVGNIVILGALARLVGAIRLENLEKALEMRLAGKLKRDPALKELNFKALHLGWEARRRQVSV